jgi:N-acetylglucosaminyldiphosphoundecaprenol N-acetyl-beta-D-mannosaminyltransferase
MHEHYRELGVPVCVQIGASLDFLAGKVRRAPGWVQRVGMEWAWRIAQEPRRLAPRYLQDARFLARQLFGRRRA